MKRLGTFVTGLGLVALLLVGCAAAPVVEEPVVAPPPPPPPQPQVREVDLPSDTLFAFGRADIEDIGGEGRRALDALAQRLRASQRVDWVRISGHTDRIGQADYNQRLSLQRAESVRDYLVERGVDAGLIQAEGRGSSEPVADCPRGTPDVVSCLAPDRRVHITVRALE